MAHFGWWILPGEGKLVKTSAHGAALWLYRQGKGIKGKQESAELSLHDGTRQGGDWAEIMLRISREFAKSIEWLPTDREKKNQERLSCLLLARSLASL